MKILRLFFYLYLFFSQIISAKVLLFTYAYNRPDFIEIQYKTFKKFLHDDYEFVVFNDAPVESLVGKIKDMCAKYGIKCVPIPQEIHDKPYLPRLKRENYHNSAVRNCNVVQYSLDTIGFDHDDILVLLDSDMFLVKDFSVTEYMKGLDIAGVYQEREGLHYLWIGLVMLNMKTLPNKRTLTFNCGEINGIRVDSGGHTHYYLKNYPQLNIRYVSSLYIGPWRCDLCKRGQGNCNCLKNVGMSKDFKFVLSWAEHDGIEFFIDYTFLHYRCGINWNGASKEYRILKTSALYSYINNILDQNDVLESDVNQL